MNNCLQRLRPKAFSQPMEGNTIGTTVGLMGLIITQFFAQDKEIKNGCDNSHYEIYLLSISRIRIV